MCVRDDNVDNSRIRSVVPVNARLSRWGLAYITGLREATAQRGHCNSGENTEKRKIYSDKKRRKDFLTKENEESKEDGEKHSVYLAFFLPWRCSLVSWLFAFLLFLLILSTCSADVRNEKSRRGCETNRRAQERSGKKKRGEGGRSSELGMLGRRGPWTTLSMSDGGEATPVLVVVTVVVAVEVGERQGRLDRSIQRTIITIIHVEVLQVILCQKRTRKRGKGLDID